MILDKKTFIHTPYKIHQIKMLVIKLLVKQLIIIKTIALMDPVLNHKVDQLVLINYNGQR